MSRQIPRPGLPSAFAEEGTRAVEEALRAMDISITGDAARAVRAWFDFYATWPGRRVTGFKDPIEAGVKLVVDSFAIARFRSGVCCSSAIDLGSGNGWPGLAVPLLWPSSSVALLDSRAGACDFLRRFVDDAGIRRVVVVEARAEEAAKRAEFAGAYDLAMSRAMASPGVTLEVGAPLVRRGGALILWLGPEQAATVTARQSVPEVGLILDDLERYDLPGGMGKRTLALYRRVSDMMTGYPRRLSAIKSKPLI